MMNKGAAALAIVVLIVLGAHCKGKKTELTPEVASSDEALFKIGQEFLKKDVEKARIYLRQVIDSFPKSFYAQRAKLAIADSYFEKSDEGNLILAAAEYREFIKSFPYSPSASLAQFRIAMCFFRKILRPGRDQTKTLQALAEFKLVMTQYPLSEEAKQAQEKIKQCEERLAEHTFSIALHYHKVRAYKASTTRFLEILNQYPQYSKMDALFFYLGDSYYRWDKIDESIPYFTKLVSDYPKSKYASKAQDRLEQAEQQKKQKK
jgi:outer membrane protein assembly factor BamD